MTLPQLKRVRWAVRGVLTLGVAASVTANVLHAHENPISQTIAARPPLALLLTIELISRVPVHRRGLTVARMAATVTIAGIAAWVSYWHMAGVVARYGETGAAPYLMPFSVDGLVIVASVCLVEMAGRIRTVQEQAARVPLAAIGTAPATPVSVPVPKPPVARTAPRTGTARKRRTGNRTDADLVAALAEVPREPDGTVPVKRAARALGCGVDRARKLLAAQGLLRAEQTPPTGDRTAADAPVPQPA